MKLKTVSTLGLLACSLIASGIEKHTAKDLPPSAVLGKTAKFTLDGVISEDEIRNSVGMYGFCNLNSGFKIFPADANFYVGTDGKNVYIAGKCETSPKGILQRMSKGNKGLRVFKDDNYELVFSPNPEKNPADFYRLMLNNKGAYYCSARKDGVQIVWTPSFSCKGTVKDNFWSFEVLIPLKQFGINEWSVPAEFPLLTADYLRSNGIRVIPGSSFFPKREFKTSAEEKKLARAMQITQESMMLTKEILHQAVIRKNSKLYYRKKLLTSELLRMEIEGFLKAHGFTAARTITAHGTQCSQPHNVGSGPILAGETIVVDIFPRDDESGYWGDMTRTFVKGEPLPVVKRAYDAVLAASAAAEKMIRAGVIAADVHKKAAEIMGNAGFVTGKTPDGIPCGFIHGLGHGVGLEIHEAPRVSPANPTPLKKGQVISNEPGLYHPSWGGIRLEDVLIVTESGSRNFYSMPKTLSPDE